MPDDAVGFPVFMWTGKGNQVLFAVAFLVYFFPVKFSPPLFLALTNECQQILTTFSSESEFL